MAGDVIATQDRDRAIGIVSTLSDAGLWFEMTFNEGAFYFELATNDFFNLVSNGTITLLSNYEYEYGGDA